VHPSSLSFPCPPSPTAAPSAASTYSPSITVYSGWQVKRLGLLVRWKGKWSSSSGLVYRTIISV
jgi:hypothetical protein